MLNVKNIIENVLNALMTLLDNLQQISSWEKWTNSVIKCPNFTPQKSELDEPSLSLLNDNVNSN